MLEAFLVELIEGDMPTTPPVSQLNAKEAIYTVAKANLGKHLTLDNSVANEFGCAECVMKLLSLAGILGIPSKGIEGTIELLSWLLASPQFTEVNTLQPGDIIISNSQVDATGTITIHGHTGIGGNFGILSNDSENGLLAEKFTLQTWQRYYKYTLGLSIRFFRAV